jgi:hypothetical protein
MPHQTWLRYLIGFLLIFATTTASAASVTFYIFEDKGTSSSGKVLLKTEGPTDLPVTASWFDYKCQGEKQQDGILISCAKGGDSFETKAFCAHPKFSTKANQVRNFRVGKSTNFVSFEVSCH